MTQVITCQFIGNIWMGECQLSHIFDVLPRIIVSHLVAKFVHLEWEHIDTPFVEQQLYFHGYIESYLAFLQRNAFIGELAGSQRTGSLGDDEEWPVNDGYGSGVMTCQTRKIDIVCIADFVETNVVRSHYIPPDNFTPQGLKSVSKGNIVMIYWVFCEIMVVEVAI